MTMIKSPLTREELANAIDSPTVAALAKIFAEPDHAMSYSERVVYVLAQRLCSGVAQPGLDPATIEACAKVCEDLRHEDYSCETSEWSGGTFDCARAIRALAVSLTQSGSGK